MKKLSLILLVMLMPALAWGGTINRPAKSFGGTSFTNGIVPQASDFNGDVDTMYSEFNGNIQDANIKSTAAISPTKINPDGFIVNIRTMNASPCTVLDESDQAADSKRWYTCSLASVFSLGTYSDAGVLQNNWLTIARANGSVTMGGTGGTNTINGATTFNQAVTFTGNTSLTPTGMVTQYFGTTAPSGWLLLDGASNSCTGASSANANLCTQLISLFASANYKGTAASTVTVDTTSDEVIQIAHGRSVNDRVHYSTTTTLPAPLAATTVYCITSVTADRYKISLTCGGAVVDITTTGTGTHSHYFNFVTPDGRGRAPYGTGTGAGLTARTIGATGGAETGGTTITGSHVLTTAEMPSHSHTQNVAAGSGSGITVISATVVTNAGSLSNAGTTDPAGSGGGHTHTIATSSLSDPFLVMTYIIKL